MKRILKILSLCCFMALLSPAGIFAAETTPKVAEGSKFTNLVYNAANNSITLEDNVTLSSTWSITGTDTDYNDGEDEAVKGPVKSIDLNGHTLTIAATTPADTLASPSNLFGIVYSGTDTLTISGGTIAQSVAATKDAFTIAVGNTSTGTLALDGVTITDTVDKENSIKDPVNTNIGVYVTNGTASIDDCNVTGGQALLAVANTSNTTKVTVTDSSLQNPVSTYYRSPLQVGSSTSGMTGGEVTVSLLGSTKVTNQSNLCESNGGIPAVFVGPDSSLIVGKEGQPGPTITGGTNDTSNWGAGIQVYSNGKVTVNSGTVIGTGPLSEKPGSADSGSQGDTVFSSGSGIVTSGSEDGITSSGAEITVNGGSVQGSQNAIQAQGTGNSLSVENAQLTGGNGQPALNTESVDGATVGNGTTLTPALNATQAQAELKENVGLAVTDPKTGATSYFNNDNYADAQQKAQEIGSNAQISQINPTTGESEAVVIPVSGKILTMSVSSNELMTYYNSTNQELENPPLQDDSFVCQIRATQPNNNYSPQNLTWTITGIGTEGTSIDFNGTWKTDENSQKTTVTTTGIITKSVTTGTASLVSEDNHWTVSYNYTITTETNTVTDVSSSVYSYDPDSLVLTYDGQGAEELAAVNGSKNGTGLFQLQAVAPGTNTQSGKDIVQSVRFIVNASDTQSVEITTSTGATLPSINTVNLEEGRTAQFDYMRTLTSTKADGSPEEVLGGGNPEWTLADKLSDGVTATSNYVVINGQTGVLTFLQPLPAQTYTLLSLSVDGIAAVNQPVFIATTGNLSYSEFTGITAMQNPANVLVSGSYTLIPNIVSVPTREPLNLTGENSISFTSGDTSRVYVTNTNGQWFAYATSSSPTSATVTATYTYEDTEYTTDFVVNFVQNAVAPTGISAADALTFNLNDPGSQNVQAELMPANTTTTVQPDNFTYKSSDTNVAVVDAFGNVTPIAEGTCTITTTYSDESVSITENTATTTVNVVTQQLTLTLSPEELTLDIITDPSGIITAEVNPAEYASSVVFESEDPDVATVTPVEVTEEGIIQATVEAVSVGTTTITASIEDQTATCAVTVTQNQVAPTSVTITPNPVYLTTVEGTGFINSTTLDIVATPEGATLQGLNVTCEPETVASLTRNEEDEWVVTAVSDGEALITVSNDETVLGTAVVYVNSNALTYEDIYITSNTPDSYTVSVSGVKVNPAMGGAETEPNNVSIFTWSGPDQNDMQCFRIEAASAENGIFSHDFSVNGNEDHRYYYNADKIIVQAYASVDETAGNLLGSIAGGYNWVNSMSASDSNVAYITYQSNYGFNTPTVFDGSISGHTGEALQLEGIRISSNIEGVQVVADVHEADVGWVEGVEDGQYAGTMHQNRQIEAIKLRLQGENAQDYDIWYQVHGMNYGWQGPVSNNAVAGTESKALQIEAIQVQIVPKGTTPTGWATNN